MNTQNTISGPFGSYPYNSAGAILNSLCHEGVPLNKVESVQISENTITYGGKEFARYKFFDGIDKPLFYFQDTAYGRQTAIWYDDQGKKVLKPKFKLSLHTHGSVSLVISEFKDKSLFTEDLWYFIKTMMYANLSFVDENSTQGEKTENEMYKLKKDSGAFFQGGSESPKSEYIYIEFWNPKGAQAFVDYINNNFVYKDEVYVSPEELSDF
jgi:hypothetical protein